MRGRIYEMIKNNNNQHNNDAQTRKRRISLLWYDSPCVLCKREQKPIINEIMSAVGKIFVNDFKNHRLACMLRDFFFKEFWRNKTKKTGIIFSLIGWWIDHYQKVGEHLKSTLKLNENGISSGSGFGMKKSPARASKKSSFSMNSTAHEILES